MYVCVCVYAGGGGTWGRHFTKQCFAFKIFSIHFHLFHLHLMYLSTLLKYSPYVLSIFFQFTASYFSLCFWCFCIKNRIFSSTISSKHLCMCVFMTVYADFRLLLWCSLMKLNPLGFFFIV